MNISIVIARDFKGKFSCLYIGDSAEPAIKLFKEIRHNGGKRGNTEYQSIVMYRRAQPYKRAYFDVAARKSENEE